MLVGATIEDLDIRDIQQMATRTGDPATLDTYTQLQCGSRKHMRAFVGRPQALAVRHQVQFITAEYYSEILATPQERCGV